MPNGLFCRRWIKGFFHSLPEQSDMTVHCAARDAEKACLFFVFFHSGWKFHFAGLWKGNGWSHQR